MTREFTRRYLLTGASVLALTTPSFAKSIFLGVAKTAPPPPGDTVNLVTDFGADPTGVVPADTAIGLFNTWIGTATGAVTLVIPAGTYTITSARFANVATPATQLTIQGAGIGVTTINDDAYFGEQGQYNDPDHHARLNYSPAGASNVQLVTTADYSKFAIGDWCVITGLDLQGYGYPTNPQFFEHVQITGIDTSLGILSLSAPLVYSYLATWPHYSDGGGEVDQGGPATIYKYNQIWDLELIVSGITFAGTINQTLSKFRHTEFHDCEWPTGTPGPAPTDCVYFLLSGCTVTSTSIEMDKMVETVEMVNTTAHEVAFQSASTSTVIITGCTLYNLKGSGGENTVITDTTFDFMKLGPYAYGVCLGSHTLTNVTVPTLDNPSGTTAVGGDAADFTYVSGGTFSIAKASGPIAWAVPGARTVLNGTHGQITQVSIISVSESGANTIIETDLDQDWPDPWGGSKALAARATNQVYGSGCSGDDQILMFNEALAQGKPLNSYFKKTYTKPDFPTDFFYLQGQFLAIAFNVTTAYAGATGSVQMTPDQFHCYGVDTYNVSPYLAWEWMPAINMKAAGDRRIYPEQAPSGIQAGDSLPAQTTYPPWFSQGMQPFLSGSISDGTLSVTIECQTNQDPVPIERGGGTRLMAAGIFGDSAIDPPSYYTPGVGNPAVSTSDYYHQDGNYWWRAYDLLTMGATGTSIAATQGRYVWPSSPDHPFGQPNWADGQDSLTIGFSNDPGVFPSTLQGVIRFNNSTPNVPVAVGVRNMFYFMDQFLFYNPDDATYPFYMYAQVSDLGGTGSPVIGHLEGVARSSDLLNWTIYPHITHYTSVWSAYQRVWRVSAGNYKSFGLSTDAFNNYGGPGAWSSIDALAWTQTSTLVNDIVGNSHVNFAGTELVTVGGQLYALVREDLYNIPPTGNAPTPNVRRGALPAGCIRLGQYVTLWPVDADSTPLASPAPIRVSDAYAGAFPGPTFLQNVAGMLEDGILHIYASLGWVPSAPVSYQQQLTGSDATLINLATYANGGGLWQQNIDYYTYIVDSSAGAQSAPCGVKASCAAGVVTLSWYDALPNRTYRVKRYTSAANAASNTSPTTVGDVTGVTTTDSPTPGAQYWWRVITLQSGTERGYRIVTSYVS